MNNPNTIDPNLSQILGNFRRIMNKQNEPAAFIHTCNADVIVGMEIWITLQIDSGEKEISKYFSVFRRDRDGRRGGGVLTAMKNISANPPCEYGWKGKL